MKKVLVLLSLLLVSIALAGEVMAYSVTLNPFPDSISKGGRGRVDVNLNLNPNEELFGFNFLLLFDPALVSFRDISFGSGLGDYLTGFTPPSAAAPDTITFDGGLLAPVGATNSILPLASIAFDGIGTGTAMFDLSGSVLDVSGFEEIPLSATANVNVTDSGVVPEPATFLLLGAGLAGLGLRKKQRKE